MPVVPWTGVYPDGPGAAAAGGDPFAVGGAGGGNPEYPGMPVGAVPVHRDVTITTATTTVLWTPAPGRKFILSSAFVSTDAAMRVALVDDLDIQGARIIDAGFAANAGASPNLVPVPYPSQAAGNVLRVVTGAAGNVRVAVQGWEV